MKKSRRARKIKTTQSASQCEPSVGAIRLVGYGMWVWPSVTPPTQLGFFVSIWSNGFRRSAAAPRVHVLDTVYPNAFPECVEETPGLSGKIGTESKLVCGWSGPGYALDGVDSSLLRPPQPHTSQLGTVYATKRRRRNGKR
ncbi:unnamed protein product [Leptosia nina]|uniref:Uncharacterized protein n=1 Tax=Leptosia nina TaxID=320188 RepID=A0AAV1J8D0_9NEOP